MDQRNIRPSKKKRRRVLDGGVISDPDFDEHLEVGENGDQLIDTPPEEIPPSNDALVFLIPGIYSDALWAVNFRTALESWPTLDSIDAHWVVGAERKQEIAGLQGEIVKGYELLNPFDLITGNRLARYRRDLRRAILDCALSHPKHRIHFICHSMGSAMVADLLRGIEKVLDGKGQGGRIDNVVLLGSICRPDQGMRMRPVVQKRLINDVGAKDIWPMIAAFVWPSRYGTVGCHGFCTTYVRDRFWHLNHSTCVAIPHLKEKVMPIISGYDVQPISPAPSARISPGTFDMILRCRNTMLWPITKARLIYRRYRRSGRI